MKALVRIVFAMFCMITSLCLSVPVCIVSLQITNGGEPLLALLAAAGIFFLIGLYYGISAFSKAMKDDKEKDNKGEED